MSNGFTSAYLGESCLFQVYKGGFSVNRANNGTMHLGGYFEEQAGNIETTRTEILQ